jgi:hypothetical protein
MGIVTFLIRQMRILVHSDLHGISLLYVSLEAKAGWRQSEAVANEMMSLGRLAVRCLFGGQDDGLPEDRVDPRGPARVGMVLRSSSRPHTLWQTYLILLLLLSLSIHDSRR